MTKLVYENFSPRPFEELADGTGFVMLAEDESYFQSEPHAWLPIYNDKVRVDGFHIRLGAYAFRDGSHGEGVEEIPPKKIVLPGRTIQRRPGKRQPSAYTELLLRIMSFRPQGITLAELSGSVRMSRNPDKLNEMTDRLGWLVKLGSLRQEGDMYIVTGAGLERAFTHGYRRVQVPLPKSRPGFGLG